MKNKPASQIYSHYTKHDFLVWETLFERQMNILKPLVSAEYLEALEKVRFSSGKIPDFSEVNSLLSPLTGWSLVVVPNISPQKEFFQFLSERQFTATCWLRTMKQLDYLEEPDMFHDVFGHVPLLSNQKYVDFFKGISDIALKYIDDPRAIELLGRIYWFTIEFGLIRENGEFKIYGAGIISSKGETEHCLSKNSEKRDFNISEMMDTSFQTDVMQSLYFVIDSFEQLYNSLPEVESQLLQALKKESVLLR
ncbi:MAG: phenylalanine 4-monooxygenase [Bacteroidota bacterium]|nr:phenylalanine 4-monooxygenase [Bacteroidota bacterium]